MCGASSRIATPPAGVWSVVSRTNYPTHKFDFRLCEFALGQAEGHAGVPYDPKKLADMDQVGPQSCDPTPMSAMYESAKDGIGRNSDRTVRMNVTPAFLSPNGMRSHPVEQNLPVTRTGVKRTYQMSLSDVAENFIDGRHRVRIVNSKRVQILIVTGDAYATVFLGDADDRTRHRTLGRTDETSVE